MAAKRDARGELRMIVYGVPVPQGSKRAFAIAGRNGKRARAVVVNDNARTIPWKQQIAGMAAALMRELGRAPVTDEAVSVAMAFYFPRPKSLRKSVLAKLTKPDGDKLQRAVLDALAGIVYRDDALVTDAAWRKRYDSANPRVEIVVSVCTGTGAAPLVACAGDGA